MKSTMQLEVDDAQSPVYYEQISRESISDEQNSFELSAELPDEFQGLWQEWYATSKSCAHDFYKLLHLLEQLLFRSPDAVLTHPISELLCRSLRIWQLQVKRLSRTAASTPHFAGATKNTQIQVSLKILIDIWELYQENFVPRIAQEKDILVKALAVPYSFTGLSIVQTIDKEAMQRQSAISLYSSMSTKVHTQTRALGTGIEHSWAIYLLSAKFQKTVGDLAGAEKNLLHVTRNLQQSSYNSTYSSALFELCDIYQQMDHRQLFHQFMRKLLLHNPSYWDFSLVGSQFCNQLLDKLPHHIRNQFANSDAIALNWAGLYILADGGYGSGGTLTRQQQKNYWAQILQLKKAISSQKIHTESRENQLPQSSYKKNINRDPRAHIDGNNFYTLHRAQLLVYYILILEHLHWARQAEISTEVLEENSILWQNVMIEIYSLSEDILQRCKNRFSKKT